MAIDTHICTCACSHSLCVYMYIGMCMPDVYYIYRQYV